MPNTYEVNKARFEYAKGYSHKHIIGLVTIYGTYFTNQQIVDSLNAGDTWQTSVPGEPKAKIHPIGYCPRDQCYHKPYLTTYADNSSKNNLDNLPEG